MSTAWTKRSSPRISPACEVVFDAAQAWLITSLREPEARLHSQYRFWKSTKLAMLRRIESDDDTFNLVKFVSNLSFHEFLASKDPRLSPHLDNAMVRHFSRVEGVVTKQHFEEACSRLEQIDEFVFTETLTSDLFRIFSRLGREVIFSIINQNNTDQLSTINPALHAAPPKVEISELSGDYYEMLRFLCAARTSTSIP
jgi:hypothetical protein